MATKFELSALRVAMVKDSSPSKIVVVVAHDFTERRAVCCQLDMKGSRLLMMKLSYDHITILGSNELFDATEEQNDPAGNLRGALGYLMNVGIELDKYWGIYNWSERRIDDQKGNPMANIGFFVGSETPPLT